MRKFNIFAAVMRDAMPAAVRVFSGTVLVLASIGAAHSQGYPNRPLRDIVPFPPGGAVDIVTRIVTTKLSEFLGQTIVVENRAGGAGGTVGADVAAKATPDGYTLFSWSIKSGKLRGLAVSSAKRSPQLPEVPTVAEAGVPGFEVTVWYGLCAPAGVPKPIIARLNADVVKTLNLPEVKERLAQNSIQATPSTPEQFAAHIQAETARWAKVVKDSGVAVE